MSLKKVNVQIILSPQNSSLCGCHPAPLVLALLLLWHGLWPRGLVVLSPACAWTPCFLWIFPVTAPRDAEWKVGRVVPGGLGFPVLAQTLLTQWWTPVTSLPSLPSSSSAIKSWSWSNPSIRSFQVLTVRDSLKMPITRVKWNYDLNLVEFGLPASLETSGSGVRGGQGGKEGMGDRAWDKPP